jgi:hypothetical protein
LAFHYLIAEKIFTNPLLKTSCLSYYLQGLTYCWYFRLRYIFFILYYRVYMDVNLLFPRIHLRTTTHLQLCRFSASAYLGLIFCDIRTCPGSISRLWIFNSICHSHETLRFPIVLHRSMETWYLWLGPHHVVPLSHLLTQRNSKLCLWP